MRFADSAAVQTEDVRTGVMFDFMRGRIVAVQVPEISGQIKIFLVLG